MSHLGFCPPGVVFPYAGATAPDGWLLCNGQEISQTTYAALFAAISTTYNTQTDPTSGLSWTAPAGGNFRVPDFRGTFMRGVGTPSVGDAIALGQFQTQKTAKNGISTSLSGVGTNSPSNISGSAAGQVWTYTTGAPNQGTASAQTFTGAPHNHPPASGPGNEDFVTTGSTNGSPAGIATGSVHYWRTGFTGNTTASGTNASSLVTGVKGTNNPSTVNGTDGAVQHKLGL